jgi:hypothetical protein
MLDYGGQHAELRLVQPRHRGCVRIPCVMLRGRQLHTADGPAHEVRLGGGGAHGELCGGRRRVEQAGDMGAGIPNRIASASKNDVPHTIPIRSPFDSDMIRHQPNSSEAGLTEDRPYRIVDNLMILAM